MDEAFEANGHWPMIDDADPDASINKLLHLLRSHSDKRGAVEAALRAVHNVPNTQVTKHPCILPLWYASVQHVCVSHLQAAVFEENSTQQHGVPCN